MSCTPVLSTVPPALYPLAHDFYQHMKGVHPNFTLEHDNIRAACQVLGCMGHVHRRVQEREFDMNQLGDDAQETQRPYAFPTLPIVRRPFDECINNTIREHHTPADACNSKQAQSRTATGISGQSPTSHRVECIKKTIREHHTPVDACDNKEARSRSTTATPSQAPTSAHGVSAEHSRQSNHANNKPSNEGVQEKTRAPPPCDNYQRFYETMRAKIGTCTRDAMQQYTSTHGSMPTWPVDATRVLEELVWYVVLASPFPVGCKSCLEAEGWACHTLPWHVHMVRAAACYLCGICMTTSLLIQRSRERRKQVCGWTESTLNMLQLAVQLFMNWLEYPANFIGFSDIHVPKQVCMEPPSDTVLFDDYSQVTMRTYLTGVITTSMNQQPCPLKAVRVLYALACDPSAPCMIQKYNNYYKHIMMADDEALLCAWLYCLRSLWFGCDDTMQRGIHSNGVGDSAACTPGLMRWNRVHEYLDLGPIFVSYRREAANNMVQGFFA